MDQAKSSNIASRVRGSLLGMAIGDAWGLETEFLRIPQIESRWPPDGPREPPEYLRVTDDTQMALAVGEALVEVIELGEAISLDTFEPVLRRHFIEWAYSPDNNRAPGRTCMSACHRLNSGMPWGDASILGSKGCGANMRVMPVGLLMLDAWSAEEPQRAGLAQFQAAITHGHPTALAASDLTSYAIARLALGCPAKDLLDDLLTYVRSQRNTLSDVHAPAGRPMNVYHEAWLGDFYAKHLQATAAEFIDPGWEECEEVLLRIPDALQLGDKKLDPCRFTGEGWIAEEALGTALLAFLWYADDPPSVLWRAATTSGDSDSIACIAGALVGALHGDGIWPQQWLERLEYRDRLERVANVLSRPAESQV